MRSRAARACPCDPIRSGYGDIAPAPGHVAVDRALLPKRLVPPAAAQRRTNEPRPFARVAVSARTAKLIAVKDVLVEPFSSHPRSNPRLNIEQRSEEHTSELQSLMRTSYAVFCLK